MFRWILFFQQKHIRAIAVRLNTMSLVQMRQTVIKLLCSLNFIETLNGFCDNSLKLGSSSTHLKDEFIAEIAWQFSLWKKKKMKIHFEKLHVCRSHSRWVRPIINFLSLNMRKLVPLFSNKDFAIEELNEILLVLLAVFPKTMGNCV